MSQLSKQEKYEMISESMINGQRKQAIEQAMRELASFEIADFIEYLESVEQVDIALDFAKTFFRLHKRIEAGL